MYANKSTELIVLVLVGYPSFERTRRFRDASFSPMENAGLPAHVRQQIRTNLCFKTQRFPQYINFLRFASIIL
jgi:hypothetical protein